MQRFKTRSQFQAVLAGELVAKTNHFALHCLDLSASNAAHTLTLFVVGCTALGAMTPKRWAKRAVTRNAIKRQIYTVCAKLECASLQMAYLVRLRREFSRQDFVSASSTELKEAVRTELQTLIQNHKALA